MSKKPSLLSVGLHIIYKMYELKLHRGEFYRVKSGQTAEDISAAFGCPVAEEIFCGAIFCVPQINFKVYVCRVGDTYASVAEKFGADAEELERVNGGIAVYPTRRLYVPCK